MRIWAYGDSFVAGDQDIPGRIDAIEEHMQFNRYNISFVSHLAKSIGVELINRAVSGSGNFPQIDKLLFDSQRFDKQDIILFGITSTWRDRLSLPNRYPAILEKNRGPFLLDLELYESENFNLIPIIDLMYITSILENIENKLGIRIFKFNCFHNVFIESNDYFKTYFNPKNYINFEQPDNTLTDVLLDFYNNINSNHDHSKVKIPKNYKRFFTSKNHPSELGHRKLADWFFNYFKNNKII